MLLDAQGTVVASGTCTITTCTPQACSCTIAGTSNVCYDPPNYGVGAVCTYYPQTASSTGCVTTSQTSR